MKNRIIITSVAVLIVIIVIGFIFFNGTHIKIEKVYSENYNNLLAQIKEGNNYTIQQNLTDGCFPYRIYHRGCYYSNEDNYITNPSLIPNPQNLTHTEIISLCYKFVHKGAVAYCLKSNSEKQKCSDFAATNNYLGRICNLKEGELIPSQMMGPYQTDTSGYKVDAWKTVEPVKSSELI